MSLKPRPDEVRAARKEAGHTQTQAAALVHKTLRAWQMWESGDRPMDLAVWELYLIKIGKPEGSLCRIPE